MIQRTSSATCSSARRSSSKPAPWMQFAAGLDLRANSHDQVHNSWRLDVRDRDRLRPAVSIRRLSATITDRALTVDIGKQFIRWGKADIINPTDRFAPRDFINVVDTEFLAVTGVRTVLQFSSDTLETVWVPWLTPSHTPLLNQRWTSVSPGPATVELVDLWALIPRGSQTGLRWAHTGSGYEFSASFFNGFNHLPNIETPNVTFVLQVQPLAAPAEPIEIGISKRYPAIRMYGADAALPTPWFTVKGETAYFTSATPGADEFVLYVVQLERQTGEWLLVGGYAGEAVTRHGGTAAFAPDRGLSRSLVGRASYTIDSNRSAAVETVVRQDGRGVYAKGEYSQARGDHWRATVTGALIRGEAGDFTAFGQSITAIPRIIGASI